MIKTKKQMFTVIGVFALVMLLCTVTYAFFNYTRTGSSNTIQTGRIAFNTSQSSGNSDAINLTNVFPISRSDLGNDVGNSAEVVITITGDTTYTEGIEYLVTATNVQNTVNNKVLPISIDVSYEANSNKTIGTEDEEYFDNRENANSHLYRVLANDVIVDDGRILVGYIKSGATGVNGSLTIKAYLDKDRIAITDTYDGNETDNMGTTTEWVDSRTVLTTTEWNALQTNGVSFKVKVESNEGIWVEEIRTVNAMNTFPTVITDEKTNIKEVYFNKMGAIRMQNAYDAATIKADITANNEGKVLAWLEENPDDNTKYNLIVASDGDTYLPSESSGLFNLWVNMTKIEFNNINTSMVTNMQLMFASCSSLLNIDLTMFDTRNVTDMSLLFAGSSSLQTINISGLGNDNLTNASTLFGSCYSLEHVYMSNFNFGQFYHMDSLFGNLSNLVDVDLSYVKINSITETIAMFYNCTNLTTVYVSNDWDISNVASSNVMFSGCTSLVGQAPNTSYAFDSNDAVDKTYARIATDNEKGYLTDVSLKPTN